MLVFNTNNTDTINIVIGPLVMYSLLFIVCIYAFIIRSYKDRVISLYLTIVVSILGIIGSTLQTVLEHPHGPLPGALVTSQVCALLLVPFIWMTGVDLFRSITTQKTPVQVLGGWFFISIQVSLTVVMIVFLNTVRTSVSAAPIHVHAVKVVNNAHISIVCINWAFLLLFVSLLLQYMRFISRNGIIILVVFGVLNTLRLIVETVFVAVPGISGRYTYLYLYMSFFLVDFVSAISLYIITLCWEQLKATSYEYNDSFQEYIM
ncbi:hypothetical protein K501DRAFT_277017 [Backusella circina FSU 941]|nr:hypothetical protein K501DRAFT_277017 [Backusella circina FSU 941]